MYTKYNIGDIAASFFEGKRIGDYYLIIDDGGPEHWVVLSLDSAKTSLYLKHNMEELTDLVA